MRCDITKIKIKKNPVLPFPTRRTILLGIAPIRRLFSPHGLSTRIDNDDDDDDTTPHTGNLPFSPRPVPIVITHRCDRKSTVKLQERSIYQSTSAPIWW